MWRLSKWLLAAVCAVVLLGLGAAGFGDAAEGGGRTLRNRVDRLERDVLQLRERLDGAITCRASELTEATEAFALSQLDLSRGSFELAGVRCEQGYAYAGVIDIPQTLQGSSLLYRFDAGRWTIIEGSDDTSRPICAGDWERFNVPQGTWIQLGLNELVTC